MTSDRSSTTALFALAAVLLLAGVIAAIVSGVDGDLADAGDDIVPLLFALAAIAGLAGWYLERRAAAGRVTAAEDERRRLRDELEGSEEERRELPAHVFEQEYCCRFHDVDDAYFPGDLIESVFTSDYEPWDL